VWSYFVVDGKITPRASEAKLRQVAAYLLGSRCLSAFVALAIPLDGATEDSAATIESYLASMDTLPRYLCGGEKRATD
jgi:hypothetical protein